jgi:hypothetical protein
MILCQVEDYHPKVVEFRELLRDQLLHRLTCDREGHLEDLLMMTILDPRFKNMDFKGSSGRGLYANIQFLYISNVLSNLCVCMCVQLKCETMLSNG